MEKQRLVWLDALKGIGMLLIILSHSELNVPGKRFLVAGFIPLFFITTGYTFPSRDSIRQIALKRSKRLLIPYFVYGIMTVVLFTLAGIEGGKIQGLLYARFAFRVLTIPSNQLLPTGTSPLWFLPAMWSATILFLLVSYVKRISGIAAICVWSIVIALQIFALYSTYLLPWCIELSGFFSLCILAGIMIHEHSALRLGFSYNFMAVVAYVLLVYYNGDVNLSVNQFGDWGLFSILLCFVIGVLYFYILQVFTKRFEGSKAVGVLAYVGRNSLRTMCIHLPVMLIVSGIFRKFMTLDGAGAQLWLFLLQLLLVFAVVALLNVCLKRFGKRWPLLRYL